MGRVKSEVNIVCKIASGQFAANVAGKSFIIWFIMLLLSIKLNPTNHSLYCFYQLNPDNQPYTKVFPLHTGHPICRHV
jgi:hypothetical protein